MILIIANYSRELADYIIYVIDVSGGDKIPRKGGPGISQSDLLIVNKVRCSSIPLTQNACLRVSALRVSLLSYPALIADRPRTIRRRLTGSHAPRCSSHARGWPYTVHFSEA
jgi:hypothetical protein